MNAEEVAAGVHRLGTRWVNFYLVVDGGEGLLIDAGYPRYWKQLGPALDASGLPWPSAVIVTHHHVDHSGMAENLRAARDASILVHRADAPKVRGERPSHPPPGFYPQAWRPTMIRYLAHSVRVGGAGYRAVDETVDLTPGPAPTLPGTPTVIETPGHTAGHCSVLLPDRGALFAGDAMVNFDYASGRRGLGLHRFNEDRDRAFASLARLAELDADTVLFGHGEPFLEGAWAAVAAVRERHTAA